MIRIRSGVWTWYFRSEEPFAELGRHPESLTADAVCVKRNALRAVFRRNGYYIKLNLPPPNNLWKSMREALLPKARREFCSGIVLEDAGIPVVEHVGFGRAGGINMLITREWTDSVSAWDYAVSHLWRKEGKARTDFLPGVAATVRIFLDAGFSHPDFHLGNLLYRPAEGTFALVDVYGVRRGKAAGFKERASLCRGLFDLREMLSGAELRAFAADCGIADAEFAEAETRMRKHCHAEWPRRRRQFLSGYAKFSYRGEDGIRYFLDADGKSRTEPGNFVGFDILTGESAELEQMLVAHFRLDLLQIPHPRIAAADPAGKKLYREKYTVLESPSAELAATLSAWGIARETVRFIRDIRGREGVIPLPGKD